MKKLLLSFSLLCFAFIAGAQGVLIVFPDWSSTTGSQNFFQKNVVKTDGSSNVYVAGATLNGSGNYDILLIKYNSSGVAQWTVQYDGAGHGQDAATGLYIDGSGNVYITGFITTTTSVDMVTVKYNSSGTQQWLVPYNGTGSSYDAGADIFVDGSGNVFVTGSSYNASGNTDVETIKYNSSGSQQWEKRYNHTTNLNDVGVKLVVNSTGVVVSVVVQLDTVTYRYGTLIYNPTSGNLVTGTVGGSSTPGIDMVNDMVQDASGNVYIVGATPVTGHGYDIDVIKLNSSLGIAWERTYNGGSSLDDIGKGVVVDASGNVFVTGYTTTSSQGKDIVTIKYNSSGTQQWVNTFDDANHGDDEGAEMAIDASGNIYVTGYITTAIDQADFYTIKYNGSGTEIWNIHNDNTAHLNDKAVNIAIDNVGDIVVTGVSETSPNVYEYLTVKYVEKSIITPTDYNSEAPQNSFQYYRNMGQIINTNDSLEPIIKFYNKNSNPEFYIKKNSFSFVFARIDTIASTPDTLHRVDVTFEKVNTTAKTYPLEERKDYLNYFLPQCPKGITEVHGNQKLITTNLYNNIDLMYSSNQDGMKYYFIVKPGGNPAAINYLFTGASSFNLNSTTNALTVNTSIGSLTYERPTVYQLETNNDVDTITAYTPAWQTNGASNKYKFYIGSYNTAKTLVIQVDEGHSIYTPNTTGNLDWSTYYGGNNNDCFQDIKVASNGDVYVAGSTVSTNLPTISGVYQGTNAGNSDNIDVKFRNNNSHVWSTYFGGNGIEENANIEIDPTGFLYITGTTSSSNLPMAPSQPAGAYVDSVFGGTGVWDMYIIKLDTLGKTLIWSTYYGGPSTEEATDIALDGLGNLYVTGEQANAQTPLLHLTGAYNDSLHGSGLIIKFDNQLQRKWATLFGVSAAYSGVQSIGIDQSNNIYITGAIDTGNTAFPLVAPMGAFLDNTHGGGEIDAYITKFNANDSVVWSTYYGGSGDGTEDGQKIIVDDNTRKLYVLGRTPSSNFPFYFPGGNTYIDSTFNGSYDAFILKFDMPSLALNWATFFGGNDFDEPSGSSGYFNKGAGTVDKFGNLIIAGTTRSTSNFPIQYQANMHYQNTKPSVANISAFISVFKTSGELFWSTYFGGSVAESAWSVAVYDTALYVVGATYTSENAAIPFPTQDPGYPAYPDWTFNNATGLNISDSFISRFTLSALYSGIQEQYAADNFHSILIYPNPTNDIVYIKLNDNTNNKKVLKLFNISGKLLINTEFKLDEIIAIDLSDFASGFYFIQIITNDYTSAYKIIKH